MTWRKSTACDVGATCVWVDIDPESVRVGHAAVVAGTGDCPLLRFTHSEWAAFLAGVRGGEFDLPPED